jgi:hypothetical protein
LKDRIEASLAELEPVTADGSLSAMHPPTDFASCLRKDAITMNALAPTGSPGLWPALGPVILLLASNVFMTFAWYGHLKYKSSPLWLAVIASWAIAFFEYWLAVPANRIGHQVYSAAELKTIQEVITLAVFAGFSVFYLREAIGWNHLVGFALIAAGAFFVFYAKA